MLKTCKIYACPSGTLGLHLSRAPWDPYPWVSYVKDGSSAYNAGIRNGDTVLQLNGNDVLGQKIYQIAEHIQEHWNNGNSTFITIHIWRNPNPNNQNINQQSMQKFAACLQHIAQLLECPVCLEVIKPPGRQCCNGHVLCNNCRRQSVKCPVCRVNLGQRGRCLLADKLYNLLAENFPNHPVKNVNSNARPLQSVECEPQKFHDIKLSSPCAPSSSSGSHPTLSEIEVATPICSTSHTVSKVHSSDDEKEILKSQNRKTKMKKIKFSWLKNHMDRGGGDEQKSEQIIRDELVRDGQREFSNKRVNDSSSSSSSSSSSGGGGGSGNSSDSFHHIETDIHGDEEELRRVRAVAAQDNMKIIIAQLGNHVS